MYPGGPSAATGAKPVRNNVLRKGSTNSVLSGRKTIRVSLRHARMDRGEGGMDASESACASDLVVDTTEVRPQLAAWES